MFLAVFADGKVKAQIYYCNKHDIPHVVRNYRNKDYPYGCCRLFLKTVNMIGKKEFMKLETS